MKQLATWSTAGVAPHTAMQLLFARDNFTDLAGYLSRAYKRRFIALNGVEAMKAVAAGRDPVDDVAAMSQQRRMLELEAVSQCLVFSESFLAPSVWFQQRGFSS
jgi:hypothetical protein